MKHLIYIPTNRPAEEAVRQALLEADTLRAQSQRDVDVLIVEHRPGSSLRLHRQLLSDISQTKPGVRRLHCTPDTFARYLAELYHDINLTRAEEALVTRMLSPLSADVVAYGAGPNKAALLASSFGYDVLHRRDSDLTLTRRDRFPGVLELAAIGRNAGEVVAGLTADPRRAEISRKPVRLVASAYTGDPPLDRRDLLATDIEFVVDLERLSSPEASQQELERQTINYFIDEPAVAHDTDFYELDTTGRTEMGVAATYEVFRWLPEMPIADTLGCDYMQKNLLYKLRQPVLYHSRRMVHAYSSSRSEPTPEFAAAYALRDVRYIMLWRIWQRHNETLVALSDQLLGPSGELNADLYAASFETALERDSSALEAIAREAHDVYKRAAARATGDRAQRLSVAASVIDASASTASLEVQRGITEFAILVRLWGQLIGSAISHKRDAVRLFDVNSGTPD